MRLLYLPNSYLPLWGSETLSSFTWNYPKSHISNAFFASCIEKEEKFLVFGFSLGVFSVKNMMAFFSEEYDDLKCVCQVKCLEQNNQHHNLVYQEN